MKNCIYLVLVFMLSGCSLFTAPREKPFLSETFASDSPDESKFAMAATDANRRVAILNIVSGKICVEPPPEAANTISEAFTALFEADVKEKGNIAASLSNSVTQNISQLYRRTQTVQLFRDAVFSLCQSALNGSIVVDDSTLTEVPAEAIQKLSSLKTNINSDYFKSLITDVVDTGRANTKSLSAIDLLISDLRDDQKTADADDLQELTKDLNKDLREAEFRARLDSGLQQAFAVLKTELPHFYETEKLRFIVEMSKPIEVCDTKTTWASDGKTPASTSVSCKVKTTDNMDKIVKEYIQALKLEANQ